MRNVLPSALPLAAISLLSWSCHADLLVGERSCHGEDIDCDSNAPTLDIFEALLDGPVRGAMFDAAPSRTVAPTWVYDDDARPAQLVPAPGGGVWALFWGAPTELLRLNAEGEPVESHPVDASGLLSSDEALHPVVMSAQNSLVTRTTLAPDGELITWPIGPIAKGQWWPTLLDGPNGRVRIASFAEAGSYVAEYDGIGDLIWKQPQVRDARHFPFVDVEPGAPSLAYRMIGLSDGSIAVGVPKDGRSDRTPGLARPAKVQGITLLDANGDLRWDMILDEASSTMFLAPGLDGSVVYANTLFEGTNLLNPTGVVRIHLIDRDGKPIATWSGLRTGYHDVLPRALCTDAAGMIYMVVLGGERNAPVPTVCRMNPDDPVGVECLGVEGILRPLPDNRLGSGFGIHAMAAPEPGVVVVSTSQAGYELIPAGADSPSETEPSVARMFRLDF